MLGLTKFDRPSPAFRAVSRRLSPAPSRALALAAAVTGHASAASPGATPTPTGRNDTTSHHLFHRTPASHLRDLESDRPDITESPITVDAGWFQVEADLFSYSRTAGQGVRIEEISAPTLNLKAGLLPRVDLQVVLSPFQTVRIEDRSVTPTTTTTESGWGDLQIRTKVNLWGNDGGSSALALMPFLHVPTGKDGLTSDAVEGGLIVPFAFDLPAGFGVGVMWEVDILQNQADSGYHADFVQTIALGRDLTDRLSAYGEFAAIVSTESQADWVGLFGFGFNYLLSRHFKLDAGLNLGLTDTAPDWNPFVGLTWRF